MTRRFYLGHHIWFVLHYDAAGQMNGLEEHDWREGGGLSNPVFPDTWEEMFIRNLRQRCSGNTEAEKLEFKDKVEKIARAFLASSTPTFRFE